jgi:protoporphyrin/coproporphyrin ferrochelatase
MSAPSAPAASPDERSSALLLVNTGTPSAPRSIEVRAFLRRFLSDPRVIELPRAVWLPLLYLLVLPLRAPRSAGRYRLIWQREGSPLAVNTMQLAHALEPQLATRGIFLRIEHAFLYSQPRVGEVMDTLRRLGVRRIAVLPLFPQSSGSTTGAVYDQVAASLRSWRTLPELRCIAGYHTEPDYIRALAESVREHWRDHGRDGLLLMSFHGIPQSYAQRGDRYPEQCRETATLLARALDLAAEQWDLSFQSRFGANRWLTPATDAMLRELPSRGVRAVTVICPGFAADCLETLEEIALAGRAHFLAAGGERFSYVPALNAQSAHAGALAQLLERTLSDWR